jgi:subtilisin family serine protease
MRRRFTSIAALLLAVGLAVPSVTPTLAAGPAVRAIDTAAPGGRLVVMWRDAAPARVRLQGVKASRQSAFAQRSLVVAEKGKAGLVAAKLRADPRVLSVVPDARVEATDWPADGAPSDTLYDEQEDLAQIDVPEAWSTTTGDPGVVVAVIDSGVDLTHPDLQGVTVVSPRNETWNTTDVTDVYGHGTHVTGTIFARANNGIGIAGIAPASTLMPIKVLDDGGFGWISDVVDGVDWARTHGADIINLSLGGPLYPEQVALFQPTFSAARSAGILVVAASGNSGSSRIFYPAALNGVVSVGAVDETDAIAEFSTFNRAVDLTAPGVETLSLSALDPSGYERASGTSMASPHVVGVAALIRAARPDLTVAELEAVLRGGAADLGAPGRDDVYGSGRIDADAALEISVPDPLPDLEPAPSPVTGPLTIAFTSPSGPVRQSGSTFTVAWTPSNPVVAGILERLAWNLVDGECPVLEEAEPVEETVLPFESPFDDSGLAAGLCHAYLVIAVDEAEQVAFALSDPIVVVDTRRPTISARTPAPNATNVAGTSKIRIRFSEPVKGVSGTTLRLKNLSTGLWVRAKVTYSPLTRSATIDPYLSMYSNTRYAVVVGSGIRDLSNNRLVPTQWSFRTRR